MNDFVSFVIAQIVDLVKDLYVSTVRVLIYLVLLFMTFVLPVLLGAFVKYLGFFN
jgi:hypothetical protein